MTKTYNRFYNLSAVMNHGFNKIEDVEAHRNLYELLLKYFVDDRMNGEYELLNFLEVKLNTPAKLRHKECGNSFNINKLSYDMLRLSSFTCPSCDELSIVKMYATKTALSPVPMDVFIEMAMKTVGEKRTRELLLLGVNNTRGIHTASESGKDANELINEFKQKGIIEMKQTSNNVKENATDVLVNVNNEIKEKSDKVDISIDDLNTEIIKIDSLINNYNDEIAVYSQNISELSSRKERLNSLIEKLNVINNPPIDVILNDIDSKLDKFESEVNKYDVNKKATTTEESKNIPEEDIKVTPEDVINDWNKLIEERSRKLGLDDEKHDESKEKSEYPFNVEARIQRANETRISPLNRHLNNARLFHKYLIDNEEPSSIRKFQFYLTTIDKEKILGNNPTTTINQWMKLVPQIIRVRHGQYTSSTLTDK